jgi:hypothetical protein
MTPEKKTKPQNMSPKRKTSKIEDFNEPRSQDQKNLCRTLFF